jgi:hypothetical protein
MTIITNMKHMSAEDFASLGLDSTVYIKPVVEDGVTRFAVHNAAGMPVGVLPSKIAAQAALVEHDLDIAAVH